MGFMKPKVIAPPPVPAIEDTQAKSQDYQKLLRGRRGRAASVIASDSPQVAQTAAKTLLGA